MLPKTRGGLDTGAGGKNIKIKIKEREKERKGFIAG